mmetsp:Transcript_8095/g.11143  ORF Transcript_8095/g.11143 Transcript_8095/m.11143 type:complete len:188 (+) Transcript_8095:133-696(+)
MPTTAINRKICVMGFRAVGKSSIAVQFVENHFVEQYNPTIENTFHKVVKFGNTDYHTEIVDTAGQDEFSILQKHYSVGVHGYVLVYSVTSNKSLETLRLINDKILNALGTDKVPRVLVANKTDLESDRKVSREKGQALASEWKCAFVECSAKQNDGIDQVFRKIVDEIEKDSNMVIPTQADGKCVIL